MTNFQRSFPRPRESRNNLRIISDPKKKKKVEDTKVKTIQKFHLTFVEYRIPNFTTNFCHFAQKLYYIPYFNNGIIPIGRRRVVVSWYRKFLSGSSREIHPYIHTYIHVYIHVYNGGGIARSLTRSLEGISGSR